MKVVTSFQSTDVAGLYPLRPGITNAEVETLVDDSMSSLFVECPMVHLIRLQILYDLREAPGKKAVAPLASRYVLVAGDIDGGLEDFLDCLFYSRKTELTQVFRHCYGYDPDCNLVGFRRFFKAGSFCSTLVLRAFTNTQPEIKQALATRKAVARFAADHQGADGATLQKDWAQTIAPNARRATPAPLPPWNSGWRM